MPGDIRGVISQTRLRYTMGRVESKREESILSNNTKSNQLREILRNKFSGWRYSDIAAEMGISRDTVRKFFLGDIAISGLIIHWAADNMPEHAVLCDDLMAEFREIYKVAKLRGRPQVTTHPLDGWCLKSRAAVDAFLHTKPTYPQPPCPWLTV